jgi:hypothetical protein
MVVPMDFVVRLSPRRFFNASLLFTFVLVLLSLSMRVLGLLHHQTLPLWLRGLSWLVDLDKESNLPSFYAAMLLGASSLCLVGLTWIKRKYGERDIWQWGILAGLFSLLAWDEAVQIHESIAGVIKDYHFSEVIGIQSSGVFHFAWVTIGLVLVLGLFAAYFPVLQHVSPLQRRMLYTCAIVYVSGALGMEMIGGLVAERWTEQSIPYVISTHIEECLEFTGLNLFIYTLLRYIMEYTHGLQLRLGELATPIGKVATLPLTPRMVPKSPTHHAIFRRDQP